MSAGDPLFSVVRWLFVIFLPVFLLVGCEAAEEEAPETPRVVLTPISFDDLPGFAEDGLAAALPALVRSCRRFARLGEEREVGPGGLGGRVADWRQPCRRIENLADGDDDGLRSTLEEMFVALSVHYGPTADGLFTGYYEAEMRGSRQPLEPPAVPLYVVPSDLVAVDLGLFDSSLAKKRVLGRVEGQALVPYYDREQIDANGVLSEKGLELIWVHDPVDAFFLHIQGSGRVELDDGEKLRVGYAGSNGLPFTGIGRFMIDEGIIPPDKASAQEIRAWLKANPERAREIMNRNARYIFFRPIDGEGPVGALGVALTPGRSLAVDPAFMPLGAPMFLDTTWPGTDRPLRRLVVAQDTGSAIKGPVRGDLYWGSGEAALDQAGRMKEKGRYFLLLPKNVAESLSPVS